MAVLLLGFTKVGVEGRDEVDETRWKETRDKLYSQHIFPKLKWNDLLRFRRVCKEAKGLADDYIKTKGETLCPEMSIYEASNNKEKSMTSFLKLGFPATKIHLVNISGSRMFEKEGQSFIQFLERYGSKIIHLRIAVFCFHPVGMERRFYEGLSKLECLEIGHSSGASTEEDALHGGLLLKDVTFPKTLKNLKRLKIGLAPNVLNMNTLMGSLEILDFCKNLEYFSDAFCSFVKLEDMEKEEFQNTLGIAFTQIKRYIEKRHSDFPNKPNLKFYDFATYHEDKAIQHKIMAWLNAPKFLDLAKTCEKYSVKLLNVDAAWLQNSYCQGLYSVHDPAVSIPVVSMVHMHGMVVPMEMPYLERISIPATSQTNLLPKFWKEDRRPWPALKVLDIIVDSTLLYTAVHRADMQREQLTCYDGECTAGLMQFLFVGMYRPSLVEVSLKFKDGTLVDDATFKAACFVGSCCPNLKRILLGNWPGTNNSLIQMWSKMQSLEELTLDSCKKIGNLAFIQTDTTDAISLTLKKLKKVSLLGLDKMPKVTDELFKKVLSQMKLTHLTLSSDKPLTNVTQEGIKSLQKGRFSESIEKFPFHGWSLADMSKKEFYNLEKEFRSYQML